MPLAVVFSASTRLAESRILDWPTFAIIARGARITMSNEFGSSAELASFCRATFALRGMDVESAKELADAIADDLSELQNRPAPPGSFALMLPVKCWVIRDDDLALVDSLWAGVTAAAGANFIQHSLSASALVGIVAAVFKTVRKAVRKGVSLGPLQFCLLLGLRRSSRGLTVSETTAWVNMAAGSDSADLTEDSIREELNALTRVRLDDGSVAALAMEDHEGRWSAANL